MPRRSRRYFINEDAPREQPIYSDGILSLMIASSSNYIPNETEETSAPDPVASIDNNITINANSSGRYTWGVQYIGAALGADATISFSDFDYSFDTFFDDGELGQYQRKYDCISNIVKDYTIEEFEELEKMLTENDLL